MRKVVQIIKVNEVKEGKAKATGNPYRLQDCECVVFDEAGNIAFVGVLMLPKTLVGNVTTGRFYADFDVRANLSTRQIEAQLVALTPAEKVAK